MKVSVPFSTIAVATTLSLAPVLDPSLFSSVQAIDASSSSLRGLLPQQVVQNGEEQSQVTVPYFNSTGPCKVSGSCVCTSNYDDGCNSLIERYYSDHEMCTITPHYSGTAYLTATHFDTEWYFDKLIVDGYEVYEGKSGPLNYANPLELFWSSDFSVRYSGWKVCLSDEPQSLSPSTARSEYPTVAPTITAQPTVTAQPTPEPWPTWPTWTYAPTVTAHPTYDWPSYTFSPTVTAYPTYDWPSYTYSPTTMWPSPDWGDYDYTFGPTTTLFPTYNYWDTPFPTMLPTQLPTKSPTKLPTPSPTQSPTDHPTPVPTPFPTTLSPTTEKKFWKEKCRDELDPIIPMIISDGEGDDGIDVEDGCEELRSSYGTSDQEKERKKQVRNFCKEHVLEDGSKLKHKCKRACGCAGVGKCSHLKKKKFDHICEK